MGVSNQKLASVRKIFIQICWTTLFLMTKMDKILSFFSRWGRCRISMRKEALVGLLWANPPAHHIPWDAPSIFATAFLGSGSWASQYDIPLTWSFQSLYSNSETKNIFSQIVYRKNNTWQKKDRFYAIGTSYCYIYHSFVGLGGQDSKKNSPWRLAHFSKERKGWFSMSDVEAY